MQKTFIGISLLILATGCSPKLMAPVGMDPSINQIFVEEIGGVKQAFVVRGSNTNNPLLLILHGGPGYPYFPYLPRNGKLKELENHYTVIYWEQRGTGKSYSGRIKKSSMHINQFVEDAHEVLGFVKKTLRKDKAFVWGHSWGSNIGVIFAARYPEEVYAYIGTGQSADISGNEVACYKYVMERARVEWNEKALKSLSGIDTADYTYKDAKEIRKWIFAYGGVVYSQWQERSYVDEDIKKLIWNTPEYSLRNKINIFLHPYYSSKALWDNMKSLNLFRMVPEIRVPVYFLLGRYDHTVSSTIAEAYFNDLSAPNGKQLIWFEKSAHRPHEEEEDKFFDLMVHEIRKHY